MDRPTFNRYVHQLFAALDDRSRLQRHPLAALFFPTERVVTAEMIQNLLLGTIAQLRPPDGTPLTSRKWRYWKCLTLRYVEGYTTKAISRELAVSDRQIRRDHQTAIDLVAELLWTRYQQRYTSDQKAEEIEERTTESERAEDEMGAFETEIARISTFPPVRNTSLIEALEEALRTLHSLAETRLTHWNTPLPCDDALVAVNPVILRQIFVCIFSWILQEDVQNSGLSIACRNEWIQLDFSFRVRRPLNILARPSALPPLLKTARHLLEAQGGELYLETASTTSVKLVITLPSDSTIAVLIIDDNPYLIDLFRRFLFGRPYRLVQARTPEAAFALIHDTHPQVIILDVLLPSRDGWQILQQIRLNTASSKTPVIVCSILPEKPLAFALGATDFLAKPVTRESLIAALERCRSGLDLAAHPGYPSDSVTFH